MKKILLALLLAVLPWCCLAENVRINLARDLDSVQLDAGQEFLVQDVYNDTVQNFPPGKYFLNVRGGYLFLNDTKIGDKVKILRREGGDLPQVNQKKYCGVLLAAARAGYVQLNNEMDRELFLANVLPPKSSPIWPDEAIKAQAIAARSYVKYMKILNRERSYDLEAWDRELPFSGIGKAKTVITKLLAQTQGLYLQDKDGVPVMAVTTVSTGGRTESAEEIFGVAYSYLQSVEDFDEDAPYYQWTYEASPSLVRELLEQSGEVIIGKIKSMYLSPLGDPGDDRSSTGRVRTILVQGEDGIARVDAGILVRQLELCSALFDIETGVPLPDKVVAPIKNYYGMEVGKKDIPINWGGKRPRTWQGMRKGGHILTGEKGEKITFRGRGMGHGVGLSAWGARGMANKNKMAPEILVHYYPNTKLVRE